jgi:hypothetical protein
MGKRYIHTVDDAGVTNAATFKTMADKNPTAYPKGGIYALANGVLIVVTANSGSAVTAGTITVA